MLKRVLVTGATGGLGRNCVEYLLAHGVQVIATGRNAAIGAELERIGAEFVALELDKCDVDEELVPLMAGVDAVWHCAALSAPWGSEAAFVAANVIATSALLSAAGKAGVKNFIHISTPAVYFDFKHRKGVAEDFASKAPVNAYAQTKGWAERLVTNNVKHCPNMRHVILRPRAIFGPYDQVLLPRIQNILGKYEGVLTLPRKGKVILDLTYVENVVHAMWLASTVEGVPSGRVYNVTNDDPQQLGSVLESLFAVHLGQPFSIRSLPYPVMSFAAGLLELLSKRSKREPAITRYGLGVLTYDMTLDISRIKKELGYAPVVSVEEGIARTAAWLGRNG